MPRRETKRGDDRTPLSGEYDVLICGASFAGLAVARELAGATRADGSPARVLMIDRYEIGERQTSACGIPTVWLEALGLMGSHRQTFGELRVSTPFGTAATGRCRGRSRPSTTASCARCCASSPTASSRRPRSTAAPATRCTPTAAT